MKKRNAYGAQTAVIFQNGTLLFCLGCMRYTCLHSPVNMMTHLAALTSVLQTPFLCAVQRDRKSVVHTHTRTHARTHTHMHRSTSRHMHMHLHTYSKHIDRQACICTDINSDAYEQKHTDQSIMRF